MVDSVLASATAGGTAKSGYFYAAANVTIAGLPAFDASSIPSAHTTLNPITGTGSRSFYVNESGVMFVNTTATAPTCSADTARTVAGGSALN
jgi:hypothetical protein